MYPKFNTLQLNILPISEREHDLDLSVIMPLEPSSHVHKSIKQVAQSISMAQRKNASVLLMMGGHVLRAGVQRYLVDLMEKGYIAGIAVNGASVIHDYEFALLGKTTESVARYIKEGKFGLWKETGRINDIVSKAADAGLGFGESVGKAIEEENLPYKELSIFAAGHRLRIPITVHVGIGYDIIHEHPNFDAAATGAASYNDFLIFTRIVQNLENGVVMNFGSSVMAPEVFLKALSMARNVAMQTGQHICHFTTLVCDLYDLPENFSSEPPKSKVGYYFRPWKTMLVRTVSDGGTSFYVKGNHNETIPALWTAIYNHENNIT